MSYLPADTHTHTHTHTQHTHTHTTHIHSRTLHIHYTYTTHYTHTPPHTHVHYTYTTHTLTHTHTHCTHTHSRKLHIHYTHTHTHTHTHTIYIGNSKLIKEFSTIINLSILFVTNIFFCIQNVMCMWYQFVLYVVCTVICTVLIKLLVITTMIRIGCTCHCTVTVCKIIISNEEEGYVLPTQENNLPTFRLNAPVVIRANVKKCEQALLFIAMYYWGYTSLEVKGWWGLLFPPCLHVTVV